VPTEWNSRQGLECCEEIEPFDSAGI
jgi:hypothetical protein